MQNPKPGLGLVALAVLALGTVPPLRATVSLQGGKKPAPVKSPEVPGLIKSLTAIVKAKAKRDGEGTQILDKMSTLYPKLPASQQRAVAKAVASCFRARRKPDQIVLLLAAGETLSRFGPKGAGALAKVAQDRRFKKKDWSAFRAQIIRLLGRPADKKQTKLLIDLALKDNDNQARAKAGEALGDYAKYDKKTRKQIVKKLVKGLEEVYAQSKANIDPNDLNRKYWVDLYAAIQDPWMSTLAKMTGQRHKRVLDWIKWYNKNKHKDWDKLGFRGVRSSPR